MILPDPSVLNDWWLFAIVLAIGIVLAVIFFTVLWPIFEFILGMLLRIAVIAIPTAIIFKLLKRWRDEQGVG